MSKNTFSPQSHIFLWDLHDVIMEKKIRHWFTLCMRFNRKWELLRNLNKQSIIIITTFILERLKIIKRQMVSEELIHAAQQTHNDALVALTIEICSAYSPISGTVQIMNELTQIGYKHHLGSNIGNTVYHHCAQKFAPIFNLFEGSTIAFNASKTKVVKKPHPDFFTTHIKKYNLQPEHIIFIDDKLSNVKAAQAIGLHAIHFKNSTQLRNELRKRAILP